MEEKEAGPADHAGAGDSGGFCSSRIPLPPQERGRQSRDRIVAAAAELIDTHGPRGGEVSVRSIASAADVSIGRIYHHFSDLDQIITAVAERYAKGMIEAVAVARVRKSWTDWSEVLDSSIPAYVEYFRSRPGLRDLWFDDHASAGVTAVHLYYRKCLAEDLKARFLEVTGQDLELVIHQVAIALSGALFELAFRLDHSGDPKVIEELCHVLKGYYADHVRRLGG